MKISEFLQIIDTIAPWELAEAWDNPGLLVGDPEEEVTGVLRAWTRRPRPWTAPRRAG